MALPRKFYGLVAFQVVFTLLQTYLISKISTIGKIGIALFYKEYALFRSGWKTFLLLFAIQLAVIAVLEVTRRRSLRKALRTTAVVLAAMGLAGLLYNYTDFFQTYSHRLLKERFHLGFYFFWAGWVISCIFYYSLPPAKVTEVVIEESLPESES